VILFTSCNKNTGIVEGNVVFNFKRFGGWNLLNENLKITANTTHYSITYRDFSTMEVKNYETSIKTSDEQWNDLIKTFDLETFTKIKDGSCRICLDGIDETFSVTQNGTTYSIYNGSADKYYQQMQQFFDKIDKQIEPFEIIAGYRK
jgi:hypothetical protein